MSNELLHTELHTLRQRVAQLEAEIGVARQSTDQALQQSTGDILFSGVMSDITAANRDDIIRQQAKAELQQQEAQYRSIFESVSDGLFIFDGDRLVAVNPAGCAMHGYTREELLTLKPQDILHPDYHHLLPKFLKAVVAGESYSTHALNVRRDRTVFDIEVVGTSCLYDGKPHLLAVVRDISERKQAETALRESQARLQTVMDSAPIVLYMFDRQGRFMMSEGNGLEALGLKPGEVVGCSIYDLYQDQPSVLNFVDRALMGEATAAVTVVNGISFETRFTPMFDETGNIISVIGVALDITERRRAEQKIQEQAQFLQSIWDGVDYGICVVDALHEGDEFRLAAANAAMSRLNSWAAPTLIGQSLADLLPIDQSMTLRQRYRECVQTGATVSFEERFETDRGELWCLFHVNPLFSSPNQIEQLVITVTDITNRKQTEAALRQTQSFLESVLNTLPHMVVAKEAAGLRFVLWNPAAEALTGFSAVDVLGKTDRDCFPEPQAERSQHQDKAVLSLNGVIDIPEEEISTATGQTRICHTKKTAILGANGEPQYLLVISEDISERKRAEAALRSQAQFLRSIYDAVDYAIFVVDVLDGSEFVYVGHNASAASTTGVVNAELAGKSPEAVFSAAEARELRQLFTQCLESGTSVTTEQCLSIDGQQRWQLMTLNPLSDANGRIVRLVGTSLDISQRRSAEEALRTQAHLSAFRAEIDSALSRSSNLSEMLQQCTEAIVVHLDAAFARIWTLNAADKTLELQASAGLYTHIDGDHARVPVGQFKIGLIAAERLPHLTNSVLTDPRVGNKAWAVQEGMVAFAGYPIILEAEVLGVVAMFARQPLSESTVEALSFVASEVALGIKRKQAELALQRSESQLRQQAQALQQTLSELQRTQSQLVQSEKMSSLGQLVAGVAHEINNPVNFIYGNLTHANRYTQDLLRLLSLYQTHYPQPEASIAAEADAIDLEFLIEDLPKLIASMRIGSERIQEIVASLRTFSRMDEAEFKAVNLHEGIDSTLMILQNRLKAKPLRVGNRESLRPDVRIVKNYGELPLVECFAGQLNQVFMNILSNALDALEERDEARSTAEMQQEPSRICIRTGIEPYPIAGTEREVVMIRIGDNGVGIPEHLRQRLFDPFFTTKPVGKGTGMGLSISYQIITERHGGTLQCISEPGQGTEFIIQIPLKQRDREMTWGRREKGEPKSRQ
jgi:PAS domain S-box-containing protein